MYGLLANFLRNSRAAIPFLVWYYALKAGYKKSWVITLGQMELESRWYEPEMADYLSGTPFFNLCGMRPANVRATTREQGVEENGYAVYANYAKCIQDYYLWCQYNSIADSDSVSVWITQFKSKSYFEANLDNYILGTQTLHDKFGKEWISSVKKYQSAVWTVVGSLLVALGYTIIKFFKKKKNGKARTY